MPHQVPGFIFRNFGEANNLEGVTVLWGDIKEKVLHFSLNSQPFKFDIMIADLITIPLDQRCADKKDITVYASIFTPSHYDDARAKQLLKVIKKFCAGVNDLGVWNEHRATDFEDSVNWEICIHTEFSCLFETMSRVRQAMYYLVEYLTYHADDKLRRYVS